MYQKKKYMIDDIPETILEIFNANTKIIFRNLNLTQLESNL